MRWISDSMRAFSISDRAFTYHFDRRVFPTRFWRRKKRIIPPRRLLGEVAGAS
jgi:hypothetical protein